MSYQEFNTNKQCEWCHVDMTVRDSRERLCAQCKGHKVDIDRVMQGRRYSLARPEDYKRVLERVQSGGTTSVGPYNYIKK